jgi:hypothetical protein
MVVCVTKGEALAAIVTLSNEGYEKVRVTDRFGASVPESDLSSGHRDGR